MMKFIFGKYSSLIIDIRWKSVNLLFEFNKNKVIYLFLINF